MKRPSFQFYPQDFMADPNVIGMTNEEVGAYIKLLCLMWNTENCELRNDADYLARITHSDNTVISSLYQCFVVLDKTIRHKRLDIERNKQDSYKKKRSEAGKIGMKNRWGANRSAMDNRVITKDKSSSSSSSSSSKEKKIIQKKIKFTPSQIAKQFFNLPYQKKVIHEQLVKSGCPADVAETEIQKFHDYWTEPNKSGSKQRWETEKTFEVGRRLKTWFRNYEQFNPSQSKSYVA